jgi:enoyl-CoA hydratase
MSPYANINVEHLDAVARVTLNRPQASNAQSQAMLQELDHAMKALDRDESVRVIILAGAGKHFSAGHDLKEAGEKRADFSASERFDYEDEHYLRYCLNIYDLSKPTIAQVHGACISAGFMVANMCDLMVASDDAFFADPVVQSLGAAAVEVLIHPWVMGMRAAKEFLFTGGRIDAAEAYRIGMVNRLVPRADLEQETLNLANRIATAPAFGTKLTKRSLNRAWDMSGLRSSLMAHFDTHELSHFSDEFKQQFSQGIGKSIGEGRKLSA